MTAGKFIGTVLFLLAVLAAPSRAFCQNEMLIGLIPEENIFDQVKRHKPLAAYLSKKLGVKVKLTILSRYGDIVDKFESRKMDGAFFGNLTGYLAIEKLGVEPIARPVGPDGKSVIQSYIFVRKDSGIKTVRDMQGKRMAFVDRLTVTGYLYAVSFFKENGIHNLDRYFREYYFGGSHDSAVYSVLDNRADIGCAESRVYKNMTEKDRSIEDELTVVAVSKDFLSATLCLRKDMPAHMKSKLRDVLLRMGDDPEGKEVLNKLGALKFIGARKSDFSVVKELMRKTGLEIKDLKGKGNSEDE